MASYLSSVLTSTTSRYNNLRKSLLSDENDGDTEDDSHISRVLRAYYIEKGRPFPSWLPPDPKSAKVTTAQYPPQGAYQTQAAVAAPRRGVGLSDLWDKPAQQTVPQAPQSLRRSEGSTLRTPQTQAGRADSYNAGPPSSSQRLTPTGSRPLPSQREGSYQSQSLRRSSKDTDTSIPPPTPGATAQDRLKAKLWGGRVSSSGQNPGGARDPMERGGSNY